MVKGSRPEQAVLSRDTDMAKTDATRHVIEGMVDGLNDHRLMILVPSFRIISDGWAIRAVAPKPASGISG